MGEVKREVMFYRRQSGGCPVEDFLDSLPGKVAQKVAWVLQLAEDLDRVPRQYFCKLAGAEEIWEFRVRWGTNVYRVLAFWDGNRVVLTHGFVKKTQRTPLGEIERAGHYRRDYFERKGRHERF